MQFDEKDLILAQNKGVISTDIFLKLLNFLVELHEDEIPVQNKSGSETKRSISGDKKKFTIENFLYYFGAMIIISAMGWFLGNVWEAFGHGGLFVISLAYFALFTFIGNVLWKSGKTTPGGLLFTCAVSIVPLAVWAFESLTGIMPKELKDYSDFHVLIRFGWIFMEIATVAVGLTFIKYRKFPFLTLPVCYALWYLSMDIVPFCIGQTVEPTWGMRNFATAVFAILMIGFALKYDKKSEEDFSKWLYIFGGTMLWLVIGSVMLQYKLNNEVAYFTTAVINFIFMVFSVIVQRRIFMVWGAIGFWGYIAHLAYKIFSDSPLFPFVLVLFGLGVIFSGIYYSKNYEAIEQKLRELILGK